MEHLYHLNALNPKYGGGPFYHQEGQPQTIEQLQFHYDEADMEAKALIAGITPEAHPGQNHEIHCKQHDLFEQSPEFDSLSPAQKEAWKLHKQHHHYLQKEEFISEEEERGDPEETEYPPIPEDWDEEIQKEIVKEIIDEVEEAERAREGWKKLVEEGRRVYLGEKKTTSKPWPGAADLESPATRIVTDAIAPRLTNPTLQSRPNFIQVGQQEPSKEQNGLTTQTYLNWQVENEIKGFVTIQDAGSIVARDGTVCTKVYWDFKEKTRKHVKGEPVYVVEPESGFRIPAGRRMVVYEDPEVIYNAPRWQNLDILDVVVPNDATRDYVPWVAERISKDIQELKDKAASRIYSEENVNKIKLKTIERQKETFKDAIERKEDNWITKNRRERSTIVECIEIWRDFDYHKNGKPISCVFLVDVSSRLLLRAQPNPYWHQTPPYVFHRFAVDGNEFLGQSVYMILRNIQEYFNKIHNTRLNALDMSLAKMFKVLDGVKLKGKTISPGGVWRLPDLKAMQEIDFRGPDPAAYTEEEVLWRYVEKLLGLSDYFFGRESEVVGSRATKGGTEAIIQQGNVKFDFYINRFQLEYINGLITKTWELNYQLMPDGKEFIVTGEHQDKVPSIITRENLHIKPDFVIVGSSLTANRTLQIQKATALFGMFNNDPFVKQLDLRRKVLNAYDEKDTKGLLKTEDELKKEQGQAQQEELKKMEALASEADLQREQEHGREMEKKETENEMKAESDARKQDQNLEKQILNKFMAGEVAA